MEKGICLNMIVKDEEKNIERLLRSVKDSIDYYVICDTGSTDDTINVIKKITTELGIKGEIHNHEWVNFGHNRTLALKAATKSLKDKKHNCNWVLCIDADEMLEVKLPFWYLKLDKKRSYRIIKKGNVHEYPVSHIINIKHEEWEWKGPAHNYVELIKGKDMLPPVTYDVKIIRDSSFQGGKSSKFKNENEKYMFDASLFLKELEKNPNDSRSQFYLAQSYKDAEEPKLAYPEYIKRAKMKDTWVQERYYSYLKAAIIQGEDFNNLELGIDLCSKAYNLLPTRPEAYFWSSQFNRDLKRYQDAAAISKHGINSIKRLDDDLFLSINLYNWGLLEEHAVSLTWIGDNKTALTIYKKIVRDFELSEYHLNRLKRSIENCSKRLNKR